MQNRLKACFVGCSFTVGEGFPINNRDPYIYDRLVARHYKFDRVNLAVGGWSNYRIFLQTVNALMTGDYDIVFCQWTGLNRIWLSPGPEEWYASNDDTYHGFRNQDVYISPVDKTNLNNQLALLNHDYQNLFDLIDFTKVLIQIAEKNETQIVFINGLVPWEDDLTKTLDRTNLESFFSYYTKNILNFKNKSDDEVCYYFTRLQNKFSQLDQKKWVNLFDSFLANMTDTGPEGHHPGINSHRIMADKIIKYLDKELK